MKKTIPQVAIALAFCWSAPSHANLLVNGGFEDGVYSSTIDGGTNNSVPDGWTPGAGYDTLGNYNGVGTGHPHSGLYQLGLGNDPGYPIASLSQGFTTVAGARYTASFYICNIWPTGYFRILINSSVQVTIVGNRDLTSFTVTYANGQSLSVHQQDRLGYKGVSFQFTGSGADTITLEAVNDDQSYLIDDISIDLTADPARTVRRPNGTKMPGLFQGLKH